ncbi:MAG: hypothetical protein FWF75_01150 [Propionibacteriaceae bacterium]|nr:hypothetical protein [Propionibacteriaceae bacterium]
MSDQLVELTEDQLLDIDGGGITGLLQTTFGVVVLGGIATAASIVLQAVGAKIALDKQLGLLPQDFGIATSF